MASLKEKLASRDKGLITLKGAHNRMEEALRKLRADRDAAQGETERVRAEVADLVRPGAWG